MKMKIGVSGYFGYGNFGDEIFLKKWKQLFHEHKVEALQNETQNLASFNRIIVGGGDIIVPNFFTNAYWREHFFQHPTYVYGVGIANNINTDYIEMEKYRLFLKNCKSIYFRDEWSRNFAVDNNLYCADNSHVVEDMAWSYNISDCNIDKVNIDDKTIGISIRPSPILNYDNVLNLCKHIITLKYNILIIPLQQFCDEDWNDRKFNMQLFNDIKSINPNAKINMMPESFNIEQTIKCIKNVHIYITERMHGMLMSLKSHTNTMTIGKSNKFFVLRDKFDLNNWFCDDDTENLIKTFQYVSTDGVNNFKNKIDKINNTVNTCEIQIEEFKNRVLEGV
jgi:polysaccharide pyruvyl transferase WcaK-like protein